MKKNTLFLFIIIGWLPMKGQTLTWLPKSGFDKKGKVDRELIGVGDNGLIINTGHQISLIDTSTFKLVNGFQYKGKVHGPKLLFGQRLVSIYGKKNNYKISITEKERTFDLYFQYFDQTSTDPIKFHSFTSDYGYKSFVMTINGQDRYRINFNVVQHITADQFHLTAYNYALDQLEHLIFDQHFNKIGHQKIPNEIQVGGEKIELSNVGRKIDHNGNLLLIGSLNADTVDITRTLHPFILSKNDSTQQYEPFLFPKTTSIQLSKNLETIRVPLGGGGTIPTLTASKNNQLFIFGIYRHDSGNGVFLGRFDLETKTVFPIREYSFSPAVQQHVENENEVILRNLVVKDNGDVMLLLEMVYTGLSIRGKRNIHAKDIIYLNFDANNNLTYSGNIPKTQQANIAEVASYLYLEKENTVYLIYNAFKGKKSAIVSCMINEDGSEVKKKIISPAQKNVFLYPDIFRSYYSFFPKLNTSYVIGDKFLYVQAMKNKKKTLVKIQF